jgi:ABC-type multidrug transport system fused ATPase/permease subunit
VAPAVIASSDQSVPSSLGYLKPYRRQLAWGFVMLLLTNGFYLGVPEMLGRALDGMGSRPTEDIMMLVVWMAVFAILTAATRIWSRVWIFNAARAAEFDLRSDLFGHCMTLSPGYYRKNPVGDVMSRLTNDVQTVRAVWGFGMVSLGNALLAFFSVLGVMLWRDWIVTLWVILPFPLIYVVGQAMSKRIYGTMRAVQGELGTLSSRIQEDLGAIQVIKTYGLEDLRTRGFNEARTACSRRTWMQRRFASSSGRRSPRSRRSAWRC